MGSADLFVEDVDGGVAEDARVRPGRATVYCRKKDAPMALMSSTSRGELRSGR